MLFVKVQWIGNLQQKSEYKDGQDGEMVRVTCVCRLWPMYRE
jgi:hypothetical protein